MTRFAVLVQAVLRTAAYFVALALSAQIAVTLNYRVAPGVPIAYLLGVPVILVATAIIAQRWSAYPLTRISARVGLVTAYVIAAVLLCVCVYVAAGKLSNTVAGFPPAPLHAAPSWRIYSAFFTGVFAGIVEETAFRGILQGTLAKAFDMRIAVLIATAVFCALHGWRTSFAGQLPFYVAIGLSAALIAHFTQSVLPGALMHLAINVSLTSVTLAWGPFVLARAPAALVWTALVFGILALVVMVVVLRQMRRASSVSARPVAASQPYSPS